MFLKTLNCNVQAGICLMSCSSRVFVRSLAKTFSHKQQRLQLPSLQPLCKGIRQGRGRAAHVRTHASSTDLAAKIMENIEANPVVVFSKSWCPYCGEVKGLFKKLNVDFSVVELDSLADGDAVQSSLADITGRRTVPQVFVGGKFIGGCDDTLAAFKSGELKEAFHEAGASADL